jgi:hypothetical protein
MPSDSSLHLVSAVADLLLEHGGFALATTCGQWESAVDADKVGMVRNDAPSAR